MRRKKWLQSPPTAVLKILLRKGNKKGREEMIVISSQLFFD